MTRADFENAHAEFYQMCADAESAFSDELGDEILSARAVAAIHEALLICTRKHPEWTLTLRKPKKGR